MKSRKGDWFLTFTGRQFWPLDARPEDIDVRDIAHHLSLTCRFSGACREFYSVAQHSFIVSCNLVPELAFRGLMHDATEAYLGDMIRPLKYSIPQYREAEDALWEVLCERFGMSLALPPEIKEMDNRVLMTERRDLLNPSLHRWSVSEAAFAPLLSKIIPWRPQTSEQIFLSKYSELTGEAVSLFRG